MKRFLALPLPTLALLCVALSTPLMAETLPNGAYKVNCTVTNYSGVEVEVTVVGKTGNVTISAISNNSFKNFSFTSDLTRLEFVPKGSGTKAPITLVPVLEGNIYTDASPLRISFQTVPAYTATQKKSF